MSVRPDAHPRAANDHAILRPSRTRDDDDALRALAELHLHAALAQGGGEAPQAVGHPPWRVGDVAAAQVGPRCARRLPEPRILRW